MNLKGSKYCIGQNNSNQKKSKNEKTNVFVDTKKHFC